jgi:hypothetical protein
MKEVILSLEKAAMERWRNGDPWNCSEVYGRSDSTWRIIHNHWSFIKEERI